MQSLYPSIDAAPHNMIGGNMVDLTSPNDPLFWLHHANVDRLWAVWQDYRGHSGLDPSSYYVPVHYEGNLLDRPMPFEMGLGWDFRLGSNYPTPREVLSNSGDAVHVRYLQDNPIPGHTPSRR
jgi:tyrosinase